MVLWRQKNAWYLDALVMARSAFSHSMNDRSAMIYGSFERVTDEAARRCGMEQFMEQLLPGRQAEVRPGLARTRLAPAFDPACAIAMPEHMRNWSA